METANKAGCGFKTEIQDIGSLVRLDTDLNQFEAWVQTTKKKEFSIVDSNYNNYDTYLPQCNNRLTTTNYSAIEMLTNFHTDNWGFRALNVATSSNAGYYELFLGSEQAKLRNEIPANSMLSDKNIYMKNLFSEKIKFTFSDCTFKSAIVEYQGLEFRDFILTQGEVTNPEYAYNKDYDAGKTATYHQDLTVLKAWYQLNLPMKKLLENKICKLCFFYEATNDNKPFELLCRLWVQQDDLSETGVELYDINSPGNISKTAVIVDLKEKFAINNAMYNIVKGENLTENIEFSYYGDDISAVNIKIYDMFIKTS
jgi:hypothetical protein